MSLPKIDNNIHTVNSEILTSVFYLGVYSAKTPHTVKDNTIFIPKDTLDNLAVLLQIEPDNVYKAYELLKQIIFHD